MKRILIIKFGALGDFAQAFAPMAVIRKAHAGEEITVLTTPAYEQLVLASGLADRIDTDGRPKSRLAWLAMIRRLRRHRYDRVYDLQTSRGSTRIWWALLPEPPEWSGIAGWGSHPQTRRDRNFLHNLDRMADQLHVAGIAPAMALGQAPAADLSFAVNASLDKAKSLGFASVAERFGLRPPFALLVPGASLSRPEKLWPIESYAELAKVLSGHRLGVGVLGGPDQRVMAQRILAITPLAVDLTGEKTDQLDFAGLGAEARLCVGNDTGPAHMAAYAGAPGVMLLSTRVSNPAHVGPRARVKLLSAPDLSTIATAQVLSALQDLL